MNNPSRASVPLTLDVGPVTTGLWCDRCLLPSGWSASLLTMTGKGIAVVGTIRRCRDGDHPLREPGDLA